jgi:hypothetical protein
LAAQQQYLPMPSGYGEAPEISAAMVRVMQNTLTGSEKTISLQHDQKL